LERVQQNRTTIIIAHRLSTVKNAHNIAALKEGRVVEQGIFQRPQFLSRGNLLRKSL